MKLVFQITVGILVADALQFVSHILFSAYMMGYFG